MSISDAEAVKSRHDGNLSTTINGALAVVAIVVVAISLRPGIVSVGPILPSIIDEFRLSHAAASLLISIPDVLMGLLALPTPWLARRFGRNRVLMCALILLCLAIAARSFSATVYDLLVSTAGIGIGIAVAGTLVAGFIKEHFATRAAVIMGIYATALSFGSMISAAATGPIATHTVSGWRLAAGIWSLLCVLAIVGWFAVILSERNKATLQTQTVRARLPLRNGKAWRIALYFACLNFLFYALVSWISTMYVEIGLTTTTAGFILATFLVAFMIANMIFGWLSKSVDRRGWLAVCGVLTLAGLIPIAIMPALAPFVFISICAVGMGGAFTLGMTLPLDNTKSVEDANAWNAFALTVGYLIAAAGPLLVGRLRDLNGDFKLSMWLLVAVAMAMCLLSPFLKPDRQVA